MGIAALAHDLLFDLIRDAQVRRAIAARDLPVARYEYPLSIADVANEPCVGLRSLQRAFLRTFGTTPRTVLTRIRLENARAKLLVWGPEAQVTSIAMDARFTHPSRFSKAYRRAFGERPIKTLKRARRH